MINRSMENDRVAQKALVHQFSGYVHAIALRYAKCSEDAQDIVQDTFIRMFDKLEQYNPALGSFKSWISKVTVRVALNKYKRFFNHREIPVETWTQEPEIQPEIYHALDMTQLLLIIQQLPEGYRAVFNLYCVEGYNHKEISHLLDIPDSTSRAMLSRAKKKLRKILIEKYAFDYKQYSNGSL